MKYTAKVMHTVLMAAVFVLPALVQHANAAATQPEAGATDVQSAVNSGLTPTEWHERMMKGLTARMLEGRRVLRTNGHSLGFILGVNDTAREVQVQTSGDRSITLPESELRVEGDNVYAGDSGHLAMK